jgi:hypothetical protein
MKTEGMKNVFTDNRYLIQIMELVQTVPWFDTYWTFQNVIPETEKSLHKL